MVRVLHTKSGIISINSPATELNCSRHTPTGRVNKMYCALMCIQIIIGSSTTNYFEPPCTSSDVLNVLILGSREACATLSPRREACCGDGGHM